MSNTSASPTLHILRIIAVSYLCTLAGCRAKQLGVLVSDTKAAHVDHTWIVAARRCWPALNSTGDKVMDAQLADPIHFRSAFSVYAPLSDAAIESIASQPVSSAPDPDLSILRNARSPILTRRQAAAPDTAAESTNQSLLGHEDAAVLSSDALCAVHAGTPVGFK